MVRPGVNCCPSKWGCAIVKLTEAAREHRSRLDFDGETFSGPALERLLAALVVDGYEKLVIEISPPMADILDVTTRNGGIEGLRDLYATPGGEPAFFGMQEEAELVAAARAALPDAAEVLWGVDYEVASDRPLLRQLRDMDRPANSNAPLEALIAASDTTWAQHTVPGRGVEPDLMDL